MFPQRGLRPTLLMPSLSIERIARLPKRLLPVEFFKLSLISSSLLKTETVRQQQFWPVDTSIEMPLLMALLS